MKKYIYKQKTLKNEEVYFMDAKAREDIESLQESVSNDLETHIANKNNPHEVTLSQVIGGSGVVPVANGGTGATNASDARTNLGITPSSIGASATGHTHDDRYYTESQMNTKLSGKSDTTHSHSWTAITGKPTTFTPASHNQGWDTITGKPSTFTPSSHNHSADNITSGTLTAARGGTGNTSLQATRNAMGLGNTTGALPVANGGTGATTKSQARTNLGIVFSLSGTELAITISD